MGNYHPLRYAYQEIVCDEYHAANKMCITITHTDIFERDKQAKDKENAERSKGKKEPTESYSLKVAVIGNKGVGKTAIVNRLLRGLQPSILDKALPTSSSYRGLETCVKTFYTNNSMVKCWIWDVAGSEETRDISLEHCMMSIQAAVIVYDITKRETFENVLWWKEQVRKYARSECVCVLVGNKRDLKHKRQVTLEEAKLFAYEHGFAFAAETSSISTYSEQLAIEILFQNVARQVLTWDTTRSVMLEGEVELKDFLFFRLCRQIARFKTLQALTLAHCRLGDIEAEVLARTCLSKKDLPLHYVDLSNNCITDKGGSIILQCIRRNSNSQLVHICIAQNKVSQQIVDAVETLVRQQCRWIKLKLCMQSLERDVQTIEAKYHNEHHFLLDKLNRLAHVYWKHKEPQKAMITAVRALTLHRRYLGSDHPSVEIYLKNLILASQTLNDANSLSVYQQQLLDFETLVAKFGQPPFQNVVKMKDKVENPSKDNVDTNQFNFNYTQTEGIQTNSSEKFKDESQYDIDGWERIPRVIPPVIVLSIDGGGMKGLSSICLLSRLQTYLNMEMADACDLVCGSSGGGVIAMGVQRHIDATTGRDLYFNMGKELFDNSWYKYPKHMYRAIKSGGWYCTEKLERIFLNHFGVHRMLQNGVKPKAFVVASAYDKVFYPKILRSYEKKQYEVEEEDIKIFDGTDISTNLFLHTALRATTAAPLYFEPVISGKETLLDGSLTFANPILLAAEEANDLWPERDKCYISLGSGLIEEEETKVLKAQLKNVNAWTAEFIILQCASAAASSKIMKMYLELYRDARNDKYYRFDAPAVGYFPFDENDDKKLQSIERLTEEYTQSLHVQKGFEKIKKLVTATKGQGKSHPINANAKISEPPKEGVLVESEPNVTYYINKNNLFVVSVPTDAAPRIVSGKAEEFDEL